MKKQKGFTLLEILVVIGVIGIMGTLITQVFITTTRTNTKAELLKDVKQNGDLAMEIMERMIRNSFGVVSVCSDTGTKLSTLEIKNPDGQDTQFGCIYNSSVTRIASTSAATGTSVYLTGLNVTTGGVTCDQSSGQSATSLSFTCTSHPDAPPTVIVSFTLDQSTVSPDSFGNATIQFQNTVSPRN